MDAATFIQKYCNFRMISGSILSGVIGLVLFFVGVFASKIVGDTSSYMPVEAKVISGDIKAYTSSSGSSTRTYFDVMYSVEYSVDSKIFPGKMSERFVSFAQAKSILDASTGSIKRLYYDPLDPSKNSASKSTESVVRWMSFGMSTLLIGYSVVAFILRNNEAMCAITTLGNLSR